MTRRPARGQGARRRPRPVDLRCQECHRGTPALHPVTRGGTLKLWCQRCRDREDRNDTQNRRSPPRREGNDTPDAHPMTDTHSDQKR